MKQKRMLCRCIGLCLACLLAVSCIGIPASAEATAGTVILPHPEEFFGEAESISFDPKTETMDYCFTLTEEILEATKEFVEALMETQGIALSETGKRLDIYSIDLSYQQKDCVSLRFSQWDAGMTVSYARNVVTLRQEEDWQIYGLAYPEYPETVVKDTLETFQSDYGMEYTEDAAPEEGCRSFTIGGENTARILWQEEKCLLELHLYGNLSAQLTVDPDRAVLPDLADFLNTTYSDTTQGNPAYVNCWISHLNRYNLEQDVLELLKEPRYQLKQLDKTSDSIGTHYTFEYTGSNADVDWIEPKNGDKFHVKLTVTTRQRNVEARTTSLTLRYASGFSLEDPDERWEGQRYGLWRRCSQCEYGRCKICDGRGSVERMKYVMRRDGDGGEFRKVSEFCRDCNGGKCRACNGRGYVFG